MLCQAVLGLLLLIVLASAQGLQELHRNSVLLNVIGGTSSSKEVVTHLVQTFDAWQHLELVLEASNTEEDVLLWELETSTDQRLDVRLVLGSSKASNLAST